MARLPKDQSLESFLQAEAAAHGFDVFGIAKPGDIAEASDRLAAFVANDWHGDMTWLAHTEARRSDPNVLWPACRSVIMLGMNYGPGHDPIDRLGETARGVVSCYAKGRDYHDVIKGRLKQIASRFSARSGADVKVFVDTAPLMEKPLAAAAGLGWQGKHTNLVSRQFGSWLFLGAILTSAQLEPTGAEADHCGNCRKCLDVCPTDAFPAPYQLDARRCIAYLTIEHQGHIAHEFRTAIGNRVFGCDDCLAVCPWNKFAERAREAKFHARDETDDPALEDLIAMDERSFRLRFSGTPVKRTGRDRFMRNVLIAAGNSRQVGLVKDVVQRLSDGSPLVRAMAAWAAGRLMKRPELQALEAQLRPLEKDDDVQAEWSAALGRGNRRDSNAVNRGGA